MDNRVVGEVIKVVKTVPPNNEIVQHGKQMRFYFPSQTLEFNMLEASILFCELRLFLQLNRL